MLPLSQPLRQNYSPCVPPLSLTCHQCCTLHRARRGTLKVSSQLKDWTLSVFLWLLCRAGKSSLIGKFGKVAGTPLLSPFLSLGICFRQRACGLVCCGPRRRLRGKSSVPVEETCGWSSLPETRYANLSNFRVQHHETHRCYSPESHPLASLWLAPRAGIWGSIVWLMSVSPRFRTWAGNSYVPYWTPQTSIFTSSEIIVLYLLIHLFTHLLPASTKTHLPLLPSRI